MATTLQPPQPVSEVTTPRPRYRKFARRSALLAPETFGPALKQAFIMLRPDIQWKNPVMFVVEIGAFLTLFYLVQAALGKSESQVSTGYFVALDIWLFLTVLFANFATALAEERGKAQADSLRKTRRDTIAYRLARGDKIEEVPSRQLKPGDRVLVKAGQVVPGDGEIIQGIASIDESAITGESAPVIREAGGDRSGVTGGTLVVSDQIIIRITSGAGESFLDRMIALVEGAIRQRTPNEIALTLVLTAFTLIFLIVVVPLWPMALNAEQYIMSYLGATDPLKSLGTDVPTLIALLVTGDNPLTAATIAKKAGVDDFLAQAKPEDKLAYIRDEQAEGKLVAMMGDGTNDAPALAQADVALAMNAGTQAAKEAANMVDLDSDPTKLIEVVEIGKQLLMTRGALTTFSIANDVAKYFAIIPALFAGTLPWLKRIDIMHLHSPTSAILSAVIFNALIIPALIPVALKGVTYRPLGADALLRRNLLIWGLGGVILPFPGIKLIDMIMVAFHFVA